LPLHSFQTLFAALATRCRNTARLKSDASRTFPIMTEPTPLQVRALKLLGL
jgi:hypothetical protein